MEALMVHEWPGNVRELERVIERAVTLARSHVLQLDDLPDVVTGRFRDAFLPTTDEDESMRAWGSRYAKYVLKRTNGNKREACRVLDISYHTLQAYLAYKGPRPDQARRRTALAKVAIAEDSPAGESTPGALEAYRPAPPRGPAMVHDGPAPRLDTQA
jgi:hypothetical protein